jgi:hypothetical protein
MTLRHLAVLAGMVVCVIAESAAAQVPMMGGNLPTFDTAPPAPPPGAMPAGRGGLPAAAPPAAAPPAGLASPQAQESSCMKEFVPLREAAEKRGGALKSAFDRKAPAQEFCKLFKDFASAEGKVLKFMTDNQTTCRIPQQVVTQIKTNHERTLKTREQACNAAAAGAARVGAPPAPKLSDELGVRGIAGPNNTSPGRGTFDTLTGSPLAR